MLFAEVAIHAPVESTFHYHIPETLEPSLQIGHLVRVAFGTAMQAGIVLDIHTDSPIAQTKPILEILDPKPVITATYIDLAQWMATTYLAPIGLCIWLFLPPGIVGKSDKLITLLQSIDTSNDTEKAILQVLGKRSPLRLSQLKRKVRTPQLINKLKTLEVKEAVQIEPVLSIPSVRPKMQTVATLNISAEQIPMVARRLGRRSSRANLLEVIATNPDDPIPVQDALRIAETSRATLKRLADDGIVTIESIGSNEPALVYLSIPVEAVDETLIELRGSYAQIKVLEYLVTNDFVPLEQITREVNIGKPTVKRLAEAGLITLYEHTVLYDSMADRYYTPTVAPPLTDEQFKIWTQLEESIKQLGWNTPTPDNPNTFLLHGVTGSGKTEIYLRAIELMLAYGRQAIFLVPEIALTPQTIRRVAERFPNQVAVVHGSLPSRERFDTWQRARNGEINIIVGTRSALFTPMPDLGLVIFDEEHDHSYKQSPPFQQPYYDARDVAQRLMHARNGIVIMGSATPDIRSMYRTERDELTLLRLPKRIIGNRRRIVEQATDGGMEAIYRPLTQQAMTIDLPPVSIVDMREELRAGNSHMFSRDLQAALQQVLDHNEQAILFLNRRGKSTYVFCRDCGTVVNCPRCDTPMTYHMVGTMMRCHHCGYQAPQPSKCENCNSQRIKFFGAGTQQVEAQLQQLFPSASYIRWDADTAKKADAHEAILEQFVNREANIMIGTQMIAKGLDLPFVTLVGVISADIGLTLPDFRNGERVFQLLTQVAGRAGRGVRGGRVILQTYQPDHYAIQAASQHDYEGFYRQELRYRRELGYPPFRRFARLLFRSTNPVTVKREAHLAADILNNLIAKNQNTDTEIIGPVPCFFERIDRHYRWHIVLRGPDPKSILEQIDIRKGWHLDLNPVDIL